MARRLLLHLKTPMHVRSVTRTRQRSLGRSWMAFWCALITCILGVLLVVGIGFKNIEYEARYAADDTVFHSLQIAIRMYRDNYGRFPHDKAMVEALVTPSVHWLCRSQDWTYEPSSGTATLRVVDKRKC